MGKKLSSEKELPFKNDLGITTMILINLNGRSLSWKQIYLKFEWKMKSDKLLIKKCLKKNKNLLFIISRCYGFIY